MAKDIKALRKRIKSFDSTLHLTGAMGLVASSKMRKATDAMLQGRKYLKAVSEIVDDLTRSQECQKSVFFSEEPEQKITDSTRLVVIAGDRGLCGGYNANVFRMVRDMGVKDIVPIGKRAFDRYTDDELSDFDPDYVRVFDSSEHYSFDSAMETSKSCINDFREGRIDRVGIVYNKYVSILTQEPHVKWILPLTRHQLPARSIWREVITIINTLISYFSYPFVRYALIVGVLIALCSSLLGVILVLKRFSYIGDGLSHVAFGAMAIAAVVGLTDRMILTLPITIICAILLLWTGQNTKIKGDAAIAMISVGALAVGYLLMNLFPTSSNISGDVCTTLFGSMKILTLTKSEVILSIVLSVVVVILFVAFYNRFFAVTFDESFAKAVGTKTNLLNLLIATIIAVIIVLAMNLVGSLLVSALVIFPALSAMRVFKSFRSVTVCAAVISVVCALIGIIVSILMDTPVGSTIVITDIAAFLVCTIIGKIKG